MPEQEKSSYNSRAQGILFVLAFVVAGVILLSDKNLQTDFGIQAPYFIHWYGMLAIAVVSLISGIVLVASKKRSLGIAGTVGSALLALFLIGDLATYSQVGFKSASQFATYLFGVTKYPGSLSYIPGLYDLLFVLFVAGVIVGAISLRHPKKNRVSTA
ncbi:MAG: hypothetical protein M1556_00795 [Candidatus Thermoplasmatota archaeon]|nr:hypothetical protein [Candidatus Thermoplasmatota archaeon]